MQPQALDPVERYVPLLLRLGLYGFLTVFFFQALQAFEFYQSDVPWPGLLWVFRTFTFLPLHEGGHFISMFFGRTVYILGGSFWQIMFPMLWFLIAMKQKSQVAPFPLFWVGENMMDVSLYVRDAPARVLPLLGGHKSGHDWYNLLTQWNAMNSAGVIADWLYYGGALVSILAIVAGVVWAFVACASSTPPFPVGAPVEDARASSIEDSLDSRLKRDENKHTW